MGNSQIEKEYFGSINKFVQDVIHLTEMTNGATFKNICGFSLSFEVCVPKTVDGKEELIEHRKHCFALASFDVLDEFLFRKMVTDDSVIGMQKIIPCCEFYRLFDLFTKAIPVLECFRRRDKSFRHESTTTEDLLLLEGRPIHDLEDTQKRRDNECSVCLFNRVEVVL